MHRQVRFIGMLSFLFCCLLLLFVTVRGETSFDEEKYDRFVQRLNVFQRKLKGCPAEGYPPAISCSPGAAVFDTQDWKAVSEQGRSLFGESRAR